MVIIVRQHGLGTLITGATFDVRDLLRNHGGSWDAVAKGWTFRREASVVDALLRQQLIVQDERPSGHNSKQNHQPSSAKASDIICTPAPLIRRARSRTPLGRKSRRPHVPDVRLNARFVQEQSALLAATAHQASNIVVAPPDAAQVAVASALWQVLRTAVSAATAPSSLPTTVSRVEEVLASADTLDTSALEAGGLVREVARIAFLRGSGAAPLRRIARCAWSRWVGRRAEAAAALAERGPSDIELDIE